MNKKTLVFGASLKENRYSNLAIHKLLKSKQEVVAFGVKSGEVSGITVDTELKLYTTVDTVTVYINPARQKEYYEYLIALKPNRIIFNPGTENPELNVLLKQNNIAYENACTLVLLSTNQY